MRRSMALAAALVPLTILLAACGTQSSPASSASSTAVGSNASTPPANAELLSSVKLTPTAAGKAPKVEFSKPLSIPQAAAKVVTPGSGATIQGGQLLTIHTAFFAPADGKVLADHFAEKATKLLVDDTFKTSNPLLYQTVLGAKAGAEVAYGSPAVNQNGQTQDAYLMILRIESVKPGPVKADAAEVAKLDAAGKLPSVDLSAKPGPSVKIPAGEAPDNLIVKVLKEGDGDTLAATDSVKVNYSGWTWADSKSFDSSYGKQPLSTPLSQVIPGWTQGLSGEKVGSTVLLVIPSTMGYGDDPSSGKPIGTLVFVVDILSKG